MAMPKRWMFMRGGILRRDVSVEADSSGYGYGRGDGGGGAGVDCGTGDRCGGGGPDVPAMTHLPLDGSLGRDPGLGPTTLLVITVNVYVAQAARVNKKLVVGADTTWVATRFRPW